MVGVYIIFMPKMLKDFGYSGSEVGIIYSAAPFMRFLLPFIYRKYLVLNSKIFLYSLIIMALCVILFFVTIENFYLFLFSNLLFGASMGTALPFVETIALKYVTKEKYGKVRLWGSIGFALIALYLGYKLSTLKNTLMFLLVSAVIAAIVGIILSFFNKELEKRAPQENSNFSLKSHWAFWIGIFLMQFSFGGFYNFFTIYESERGLSLELISYLWIFGVICEIVMLFFQGPILAKYSLRNILIFTTASASFRWLLLATFPTSILALFIAQSTHALNFALFYSASIAYVYNSYAQKNLAQQFLLGVGFGLGGALGAMVAGWIYDLNSNYLFAFEAIVAFIASLFLKLEKRD